MSDLISRQAVKEVFPKWKFISYEAYLCAVLEIDKLPSVNTEKTGHWINYKDEHSCSRCKEVVIANYLVWDDNEYEYCPYCGCRMVTP